MWTSLYIHLNVTCATYKEQFVPLQSNFIFLEVSETKLQQRTQKSEPIFHFLALLSCLCPDPRNSWTVLRNRNLTSLCPRAMLLTHSEHAQSHQLLPHFSLHLLVHQGELHTRKWYWKKKKAVKNCLSSSVFIMKYWLSILKFNIPHLLLRTF